jgi:hypothetical protein
MTKPFSQELYDTYNESVINQVTFNLHIKDHMILLNSDRYDVDLVILDVKGKSKGMPRGYIEVEYHGKYWKQAEFPFPTVHFLGRKTKYAGDHVYYVMTNYDGSSAVMIPFNKLVTYKKVRVTNVYVEGESMYNVPKADCVWGWTAIAKFIEADLAIPSKKVGLDQFT